MRRALRLALQRPVVVRSTKVSAVVGTALVAINQGDALLSGEQPNWLKLGLTYCVPYLVATYGAVAALIDHDIER